MNTKSAPIPARDPNRIAILLPDGERWRAVAVERASGGARFVAQHDSSVGFELWVSQVGVSRVLAVLPARETICRTFALPVASHDQLELALRLQAETVLLGGVPPHRVGLGILPAHADAKTRQGLLLAWPESMATAELPQLPEGIKASFVPELACLAALVLAEGRCSGITMVADRADGSVVLLVPTGTDEASSALLAIRSTREDGSESDSWRQSLLRAARETLLSSEVSLPAAESMIGEFAKRLGDGDRPRTIVVPGESEELVRRTLSGGEDLDAATRLTVAGALVAADGPLAAFTRLLHTIPRERPHPVQAAIDRISDPRLASRLILAAILVVMLAPLTFASIRYGILSLKIDDLETLERSNRLTRQQVAMYRELRSNAWPMGKVLGDLANAMPEGVDVETISIGQSEGVTVRGVAKPTEIKAPSGSKESLDAAEVVGRLQHDLEDSGIFRRAKYEFKAEDGRGWREFTMTCEVSGPTRQPPYTADEDYAVRTLRDRRYPNWREIEGSEGQASGESEGGGEPPVNARASGNRRDRKAPSAPEASAGSGEDGANGSDDGGESMVATGPEGEEDGNSEGNGEPSASGSGSETAVAGATRGIGRRPTTPRATGADGGGATPPQPTSGVNVEVPPPMTDEEIGELSKPDALALLNRIAKARQSPSIDADTKNRLRTDFDRLMQHIRKAP